MRPFLLALPAILHPARAAARAAATVRPHTEVVRLIVLVVLAFILAFYLDARDANADALSPSPTVEISAPLHGGAVR